MAKYRPIPVCSVVDKAVSEAEDSERRFAATAAGDRAKLRGIPCVGAAGGAVKGTIPHREVLRRLSRG